MAVPLTINDQPLTSRFRLNRCFVNQHHRNVILDRVYPVARVALEGGAVFHQFDWGFAVGTREKFKQRCVEGHAGNYSILR